MWLVVYKQEYYPSVYECETKEEAQTLYDKIIEKEFGFDGDVDELKVYISKIEKSYGKNSEAVDWYLGLD